MEVSAWGTRQIRRPGYLPAQGTPPSSIHYDLWIGPSPCIPSIRTISPVSRRQLPTMEHVLGFRLRTGRGYGQSYHGPRLNAIDAEMPTSAVAEGEPFNPEVTPVELKMTLNIPRIAGGPRSRCIGIRVA